MRFKKFYMTEKVYGKNAVVYHRTGNDTNDMITDFLKGNEANILARIKKDGMKTGYGDMYGKGVYTTYSLNTQLSDSMSSTYGKIIIKLKANLNEVLIFDYDVSKIINGKNYTLVDQLNKFGLNEIATNFSNESKKLEKLKYTSDIALKLSRNKQLLKKIKGMLFTGRHDGNVLVIYDTKAIVPMSINTTIDNPNKLDRKEWIDIKNKNLIKQAIDIQTTTIDKQQRDKLRNLQSSITNIDMKKLMNDYPLFVDNFISGQNIDIEITKEGLQLNSGTLKMKEVDDEKFLVAKGAKLYCDVVNYCFVEGYVECKEWKGGEVKDKAEVKCDVWKRGSVKDKAEVKCKEWKYGLVEDNAKVECKEWEFGKLFNKAEVKCKEWENGEVKDNAKVECDLWKDGEIRNEAKVECKEWKKGWVYDNTKVECNVWEIGYVSGEAEVKCNVWKKGSIYNNTKVKCKEWKSGKVHDNTKVECNVWKDGEIKDNAKVYIKGKLKTSNDV